MNNFLNSLQAKQRNYYNKLAFILALQDTMKPRPKEADQRLSNDDMFEFCRFNDAEDYSPSTIKEIQAYSHQQTGNSCLHIAAEYGNLPLSKYILKTKLIPTTTLNRNKDNPLFHTLKHSTHQNFERTALLLSKHTDLTQRDGQEKLIYEVDLPTLTKSRVRILETLRQEFYARLDAK